MNGNWMEKYTKLPEMNFQLKWGEATIDIEVRYDWHTGFSWGGKGFHSISMWPDICIPLTNTGFYHDWYIKSYDNDYPQEPDMKTFILNILGEEPKQLKLI